MRSIVVWCAACVLSACPSPGAGAPIPQPSIESRSLGAADAFDAADKPDATDKAETSDGEGMIRTLGALGIVLSLIGGAAWGVRRAARRGGVGLLASLGPGGRAPSGVLEVLARYPVGRGSTLVLLKLDRRVLLLNQNNSRLGCGSMSTLCEISDAEDVASILLKTRDDDGESLAKRFQGLLSREEGVAEVAELRQPIATVRTEQPSVAATSGRAGVLGVRGRLQSLRRGSGAERVG